jgi:hypothetical protein
VLPPILPDALLWRRVPEWHWVDDGSGGKRPSSAAFEDDPDGSDLSCTVAAESTLARAFDPVRGNPKAFALAEFRFDVAIAKGQAAKRDPTEEEPAHVLLVGKKTKGVRNALVTASRWAWPPPGRPYPTQVAPQVPDDRVPAETPPAEPTPPDAPRTPGHQ